MYKDYKIGRLDRKINNERSMKLWI
jgi:hypothetical protein